MKALKTLISIVALTLCYTITSGFDIVSKNEAASFENFEKPKKKYIKVALLLDTSNSMDGLINQAKAKLWDIINELSYARHKGQAPNLEIALYEYGNDNLSSQEGYIRQVIGFTNDLDDISEKLFSLTTNGGSEFCGHVIQTSLNQLEWGDNPDDLKLIFIAGNEPFTQGTVDYRNATANAKEKDVVVNTIFCGNHNLGINGEWKNGAILTDGDYMSIDHNEEIVQIVTPYDDLILQLNIKLNNTYIPYGNRGYEKMKIQATQDANAASVNEEVQLKRTVSKSSGLYKNTTWDLVDAAAEKDFSYDDLEKKDLPEPLKEKSTYEIKKYVAQKAGERSNIQKEIQALNAKRKKYIAEEKKNVTSKGLENAMIKALKSQASKKDYIWQ
ncbi:vWA domain-containing protein [Leptobacterium sp. I13]|uniref:vWA domain-containing protein n=1 Tax=Leptobacterium meishanense TaxID=3128904 RepID=UPI0030ED2F03